MPYIDFITIMFIICAISLPILHPFWNLFLHQYLVIIVCIKLPKHIKVVHNVKVGRLSDRCVRFHSIRSNNKSVDWNRADVHPQDGIFGSYTMRDISNNFINFLAAVFLEWFDIIVIKVHEGLEVREALIGNPQHRRIGRWFHICCAFQPQAVLVVRHYWRACFSPLFI